MTIIELLVKIANGEEVPKRIKFENYIYVWRNCQSDYFCEQINRSLESIIGEYLFNNLNLEIEIVEEDEKPKKIKEMIVEGNKGTVEEVFTYTGEKNGEKSNLYCLSLFVAYNLPRKINELVKAVNYLLENSDKEC